MTKQMLKKYFIFQEGHDILMVINADPEEFDDDDIEMFWTEVKSRGFKDALEKNVETLLQRSERGQVFRIGGYGPSHDDTDDRLFEAGDADPDQPLELRIAVDRLSAMLVIRDGQKAITEEQVRKSLEEAGVVYGIIEENIAAIVNKYPKLKVIEVAEGTHPTHGSNAEVELLKEIKTDMTPETSSSGRADFKKLNLISPVQIGDIIQARTPPTMGNPGKDIFGDDLPARDGKDCILKKGINTKVSEDGKSLVATEEGFLFPGPGGTINVKAVYIVSGDVDYHTGIVEYKGDVIVKGDVRSGFNVTAGGDITIFGSVEDTQIVAKGGIQINGGVRSSGIALLKAEEDIKVGFIENTRVETPANVYINREAVNCEIYAGGDVEVLRNEGRIIGGHISAGGWIAAPTLGSEMGSLVELALEPKSWQEPFKKLQEINERMNNVCDNEKLNDEQRSEIINKLIKLRAAESVVIDDIFNVIFISAKDYPSPVNVRFGNMVKKLENDIGPATFSFKGLEIRKENRFIDSGKREKLKKEREAYRAEMKMEKPGAPQE